MAKTALTVKDGLVVSLDYTLRLEGEEDVYETTAGDEPLEFLQGQGEIVPGLEQALYGMAVGEEKDVVVAPDDGYGDRDPEAYEEVERDLFPPDVTPTLGMELRMEDDEGEVLYATVTEITPEGVLLDFNHPLAGETLHFHVKLAGLRPATKEELAHGHVHGAAHDEK